MQNRRAISSRNSNAYVYGGDALRYRGPSLEVQLEHLSRQVRVLRDAIELLATYAPEGVLPAVQQLLRDEDRITNVMLAQDKEKQGF